MGILTMNFRCVEYDGHYQLPMLYYNKGLQITIAYIIHESY